VPLFLLFSELALFTLTLRSLRESAGWFSIEGESKAPSGAVLLRRFVDCLDSLLYSASSAGFWNKSKSLSSSEIGETEFN